MSSRFALGRAIFGRRDIGVGMTTIRIITGCREPGCWRRSQDICGRRDIGDGAAVGSSLMKGIGDRRLDSMAGSTMDSGILAMVMKAGVGRAIGFTTTNR